ncbi:hypothetical protein LINPERPRIM_LOCUS3597 [Linum perenne]|jgi:hypothetical protein
MGNR